MYRPAGVPGAMPNVNSAISPELVPGAKEIGAFRKKSVVSPFRKNDEPRVKFSPFRNTVSDPLFVIVGAAYPLHRHHRVRKPERKDFSAGDVGDDA